MVLRLFQRLWNPDRSALEREYKRIQESLSRQRDQDAKRVREEEESREDALFAVLISDEIQRFEQQLREDLADATTAARLAYAQAEEAERMALDTLRLIQDNALLLPDGRRVYFDAKGDLHGEDHRRIMDADTLNQAERLLRERATAPTYEEYDRASQTLNAARKQKEELGELLDRLDDLQSRIDSGELSPEDLIQTRGELDKIVASMPTSAREAYEDLRTAHQHNTVAYKEAGNAFDSAPVLQSDFERASSGFKEQRGLEQDPAEPDLNRKPAYKPIPPIE